MQQLSAPHLGSRVAEQLSAMHLVLTPMNHFLQAHAAPHAPSPRPRRAAAPAYQVPLALIGLLAFNVPWSMPNLLSILVGTLAGVVFAVAKSKG